MGGVTLLFDYFIWHYSRAFSYALALWANGMWFIVHFFSIPLLFRTLFSPWRRMHETYHRTGVEDFFGTIIVNSMTRLVGFIVRFSVLLLSFALLLITMLSLVVWIIAWVALPVLVVVSFIYGVIIITL